MLFNTVVDPLCDGASSLVGIHGVPASFCSDNPEKIWVRFGWDLALIRAKRKAYEGFFPIYNRGEALKIRG